MSGYVRRIVKSTLGSDVYVLLCIRRASGSETLGKFPWEVPNTVPKRKARPNMATYVPISL